MEKIETNKTDFQRKNLLIWIGFMNEKPTTWIGTLDNNMAIDYKMDFENRNSAIDYISSTLKKLSENNNSENNLREEDIQTIRDFLEKGENKLETKGILKN